MFDGGYAEYTCVPAGQVKPIASDTDLPWKVLGALPEMIHTTWGALFTSLCLQKGDTLLIRGGTPSIGLAAAAIARRHGAFVVSTTRKKEREQLLRDCGAQDVIIETDGCVAEEARKRYPEGFDKVMELVGATTLADSLKAAKQPWGVVCTVGIVGGKWTHSDFMPNAFIPSGVYMTVFSGSNTPFSVEPVDEISRAIANCSIHIPIKTYRLEQIVEAHRAMDESTAAAKMILVFV